ncbi:TPA: methionine--tRNA ligase [Candidatus Poribacteria bacterium]|nr:methionine--tRNA ligase [Candidatus Poribacteria bacterium]
MKEKFYLTSSIPYVHQLPHLGNSFELIGTDALARYKRLADYDVFFLTGSDENSLNVERKTRELNIDPQTYCDQIVTGMQEIWRALNISYDYFIRTTYERHIRTSQDFFQRAYDNGDIYKDFYKGWYCVSCEAFYIEDELTEDKKCPIHNSEPEWVEEENYFFRLSKYQDKLLQYIEKNPDFIQPQIRRNEMLSFINMGLRDFSISRASTKWGIPTPLDPNQRIYVWFDALVNYLSGIGYIDEKEKFERYWPADVHIIGKDIARFHCIYWPAMLMSVGLPLPKSVFVHGWVHLEGERMSKSRGIYIDPTAAVREYGADPIRYFLLREVPFGSDGDFSWQRFVARYNADLANDLGNLLNRTLSLAKRNFDGKIPKPAEQEGEPDTDLIELALSLPAKVDDCTNRLAFNNALEAIFELVRRGNKYIDETAPWQLAKEDNAERLGTVLYNCLETLRFIALLISPFMPESANEIRRQMGLSDDFSEKENLDSLKTWGGLPSGITLGEPKPIFPRIQVETGEKPAPKKETDADNFITMDDFRKVDLRVAEVLSAEKIKGADKLLRLQVDVGHNEERQIVAGIAEHYEPDDLIGKKIVLVANLQPAKIRGVDSYGMLLAAVSKNDIVVVAPDKDVPLGARVR